MFRLSGRECLPFSKKGRQFYLSLRKVDSLPENVSGLVGCLCSALMCVSVGQCVMRHTWCNVCEATETVRASIVGRAIKYFFCSTIIWCGVCSTLLNFGQFVAVTLGEILECKEGILI